MPSIAKAKVHFDPNSWLYRELDFMRAAAYGLAVSLIIVGIGAGVGPISDKSGFLLTVEYVTAILGILLFISFDGILKHRMRHKFLHDDATKKLIQDGKLISRTIRAAFILLLGFEVCAVFYFAGWGAYFVVSDCQNPESFRLLGAFCFCTAVHNLFFFNLIDRGKDVRRWWWWLDILRSLGRVAKTVLFDDARETNLSDTVWITQFKKLEGRLQEYLKEQEEKADPIRQNVGVLWWWFVMTLVRILLHVVVQLCAYHLIVFNCALGVLLFFSKSHTLLTTHAPSCPSWVLWILISSLGVGYFLTSFCELSREGAYRGKKVTPTKKVSYTEQIAQVLGNITLPLLLVWAILNIESNSLIWIVVASQLFIITAMALVYHFDDGVDPSKKADIEGGSQVP